MRLLAGTALSPATADDTIRIGTVTLSPERLLACANAVADDIRGEPVVAVHATASAETVVAIVGAMLAGAAVVPVPPDSGPRERTHILRDSGATLLLAGGPDPAAELRLRQVDLNRSSDNRHPEPKPEQAALIMYTSGTTGPPKGAVLSHRALEAGIDALADAWDWHPDDLLVHGLPLFHVHGLVLGVLGALRVGCRLHHTGRPDPEAYAAAAGTIYFGVPTVWSRVCAQPAVAGRLRSARLLVSGSAALPTPLFARMQELTGHRPVERYGMTETLITLSNRADDPAREAGLVGTPVAGVEARVVGEDGSTLPADGESIGELWVRGPMLFDGYLGRPEVTAQSLDADGWFRTGDIARTTPGGAYRIVGRRSTDMIKSGGYRIGAGEVEDALLAHPAVREAAVLGTPDDDLGQQVTAFVVAEAVTAGELVDFVARTLSAHKRPRQVRFVEALPRNAMGKVQKHLLKS
jgi:fatty acid CoA ligase FadD36